MFWLKLAAIPSSWRASNISGSLFRRGLWLTYSTGNAGGRKYAPNNVGRHSMRLTKNTCPLSARVFLGFSDRDEDMAGSCGVPLESYREGAGSEGKRARRRRRLPRKVSRGSAVSRASIAAACRDDFLCSAGLGFKENLGGAKHGIILTAGSSGGAYILAAARV